MTTMIIARHGNNFDAGETAVRIGIQTNIGLSASGKQQAKNIGDYLKLHKITLSAVFCSELIRTKETANIALQTAGINLSPIPRAIFNEIDYGPDEGKTYDQIIERIGAKSLEDWETFAVVPDGWVANVDKIIDNWKAFADEMIKTYPNQTILVITSNGVARFVPYLTEDFFHFSQTHKIKLATGALGSLTYNGSIWQVDYWNEVPNKQESNFSNDDPVEYGSDDSANID